MTRTRIIAAIAVMAALLLAFGRPPEQPDRGDTLIVLTDSPPDSIDPGVTYMGVSWQILFNAYDGLLSYQRAGASDGGNELVPDLAESMPTVTDGGKTYTFTMRRGVMFSPPTSREVLPSDMKWGMERLYRLPSQGMPWYQKIEGAQAFIDKQAKGVTGIVADDEARTIAFHLIEPDPVFAYKMAMMFAVPVPKEIPAKDRTFAGFVPGTGPYMFKSYEAQRKIVMVRNPNFKRWTEDVPDGIVDRIEIRIGISAENAVTQIRRGDADYMQSAIPKSKLVVLLADRHWKHNVHIEPEARINYVWMNTTVAPFNNRKVRQAVNWAIDRRAMVKLAGGQGNPSENLLPPDFPGYKEHSLYPKTDVDRARQLIEESGVTPGKISFWCMTAGGPNPSAEFMQHVLGDLGFEVQLKCLDPSVFFTTIGNPKLKPQIGFGGWGQDFPEGSDFIDVLLNGKRIMPEGNSNYAMYSRADDDIAAANALLDQKSRDEAWTKLDEQIAKDAPWAVYLSGEKYELVSDRVDGYVNHPTYNLIFSKVKLKRGDGS